MIKSGKLWLTVRDCRLFSLLRPSPKGLGFNVQGGLPLGKPPQGQ